jgi:hypothetical protein
MLSCMSATSVRAWSRLLVLALVAVAALSALEEWVHALAGIAVLVAAGVLVVRVLEGAGRAWLVGALVGAGGTAAACLAGWWYLDSETDAALTTMTVAWLVATAAYAGLWWSSRRAVTGGQHRA